LDTSVLVTFILVLAIFIVVEHTLMGRINKKLEKMEKLFLTGASLDKRENV
jgi:hypothetical protein